ncbi:chemotaxis protein CheA [Pigmentiphaga aceris]|uniref:Chemotaxis protein CheA n=1 Tax=Pigmentiphaga aceris TaxID=1940612 RepID=A0A5C0B332_9BURK|nr:chemotaxis protein CheA [Pigmentiphaga aceris]QEI08083.1 chemotaxis protein CheA [Pigmentiphaga aceris]
MNLDDALQTFIVESRELLEDMEAALLSLGRDADDSSERVNAIFRAAHTVKGSAGLFGLDHLVSFTHVVESVLDDVRAGNLAIDDSLVALLLACGDHIGAMVALIAAGRTDPDPELTAQGEPLLAQLQTYLVAEAAPAAQAVVTAVDSNIDADANADLIDDGTWHISLRFGTEVLRNGMDPLSFIRYLGTLGTITAIVPLADALPEADQMDPEQCYLGFEIVFRTEADRATIESVFEFVQDDCVLHLLPPKRGLNDYVALVERLPETQARLVEALSLCGAVDAEVLNAALLGDSADAVAVDVSAPVDALPADTQIDAALNAVLQSARESKSQETKGQENKGQETKSRESPSIRIDADKLDHLIDLVGELIIMASGAQLAARRVNDSELQETHSALAGLVEAVRDSTLQLRMVKIGGTFSRFQRVVHDVARELGKDIELKVSGEDAELDKTVVERIADPLTHLVRNAMDHGIESAELRAARGKPARGTVRLNAFHDSGAIVIEVGDDGGGLQRDRILEKAVERGLVEPGRHLSDGEIYALIFEPGFSTAAAVTNLSGRGVGMDVVKRNIAELRGSVSVASEPGQGTTVTVRLPLTLAIINGFQVTVGKSVFVVPLDMIDECVEFSAEPGHDYTNLRGEVLPFMRVRDLFSLGGSPEGRENIVVVRHAGRKVGLVVDTLLGEFQTVIKPLGRLFSQIRGISGSSISGSGEVVLILDVPVLMERAAAQATADRARHPLTA